MDNDKTEEKKDFVNPFTEKREAEEKQKAAEGENSTVSPDSSLSEAPLYKKPASKKATKEKSSKSLFAVSICLSILSLAVAGSSVFYAFTVANNQNSSSSTTTSTTFYTGNSVQFESTSVAAIAEKVTPAVVSIISTSGSNTSSIYQYLYGGGGATQSAGTGMIVTYDGYVITNKHVIEDTNSIEIITDSGESYSDVVIVGEDPLNDVAYLKINGVSDLPTVTLGDSKSISVGQTVLAIGNALGAYQNTVTSGIISGAGRSITATDSDGNNATTLSDMIQTDAAINSGNSGGPLVNANGDVIGINTAVTTDANNIGFAIPISAVKGMLANIIENGDSTRAYLGVSYIPITAAVAKSYDLSVTEGAYVYAESSSIRRRSSAVASGSPADKAGIQDGDIIIAINDIRVGSSSSVTSLIGEHKVGDTVKITYIRDGNERSVDVVLEAYPNS